MFDRRISVIGVGNPLMGDDGVGMAVAATLQERFAEDPDVEVVAGGVAGMALMPAVLAADDVVFIDALAMDVEPGAIFRFDPDEAGVTGLRSTTSHGMGIPYLITNARMQGHFPSFLVYAVQIEDIMAGPDTLSESVAAAVPQVAAMIAEDVSRLRLEQQAASLLR